MSGGCLGVPAKWLGGFVQGCFGSVWGMSLGCLRDGCGVSGGRLVGVSDTVSEGVCEVGRVSAVVFWECLGGVDGVSGPDRLGEGRYLGSFHLCLYL